MLLTILRTFCFPSAHTTIQMGRFGQLAEKLLQKLNPFKEKIKSFTFYYCIQPLSMLY